MRLFQKLIRDFLKKATGIAIDSKVVKKGGFIKIELRWKVLYPPMIGLVFFFVSF